MSEPSVQAERHLDAALRRLDPLRLQALLTAAVDAYSPTFAEEPATAVFAQHVRGEGGLRVERQPVSTAPGGPARGNLLLRLGPEAPGLLLVGHVDTIHAGEGAMRFAGAQVEGDLLTGLGAADMKSGCAAMVEAVLAIAASGIALQRGIVVALVVGEEEYGDGSAALPDDVRAPLCVVGEPTSLQPCTEHFGYLESRLQTYGTRTHAALAGGGGAIHAMLSWMLGVLDGFQAAHPDGAVAANPRLIRGGDNLFIVAEHCEAMLDVHWRHGMDADAVLARVADARAAALASHPACQFAAETLFQADAFRNDPDDVGLAALRAAFAAAGLAWAPGAFPSHSDAGIFQARGAATVVCGPGALAAAHAPGESVSLRETAAAARLYTALAVMACAG